MTRWKLIDNKFPINGYRLLDKTQHSSSLLMRSESNPQNKKRRFNDEQHVEDNSEVPSKILELARKPNTSSHTASPLYKDTVIKSVLGVSPSIKLPLEQNVACNEDRVVLDKIDKEFSSINNLAKIFQKRITDRGDTYLISYGWKYEPSFQLSLKSLSDLKANHLSIIDITINPTGSCCSKISNIHIGIATPCYCDYCDYERKMVEYLNKKGQHAQMSVNNTMSLPSLSFTSLPQTPQGSNGRLLIVVKKTLVKTPQELAGGEH